MCTSKASVDLLFEKKSRCRRAPSLPGGTLEEIHSLKLPGWDVPSQTLPGGVPPHFHTSWLPACSRCVPKHVPIEQSLFTMFETMFVSVEIRETVPKHVQTRYFKERVRLINTLFSFE